MLICWIISVGKTIIMNEKGCTLCLWKYKKSYTWAELKIRYIEDKRDTYGKPGAYSAYAIFSTHKINKSRKTAPYTYNWVFHPFSFSFFYVFFQVKNMMWGYKVCVDIYPVDEKEFMEKMQEWGVELEVYNAREERFK